MWCIITLAVVLTITLHIILKPRDIKQVQAALKTLYPHTIMLLAVNRKYRNLENCFLIEEISQMDLCYNVTSCQETTNPLE